MHKDKKRRLRRPLQVPAGRGSFQRFQSVWVVWMVFGSNFSWKEGFRFFFGGRRFVMIDSYLFANF